jgi:hypothetical protein
MKKNKMKSMVAVLITFGLIAAFTACEKEEAPLELPYLFRPVNFTVDLNKTVATFSWAKVDSATSYTLQVSTDSLDFTLPLVDTTVTVLAFSFEFAGNTEFFARVRANAPDAAKNSMFNPVVFKTPSENIFEGYKSEMIGWQTVQIKWLPGANVTHLILTAQDLTTQTVPIPAANAISGTIQVAGLANSVYTVKIQNGTIVRGIVPVLIEGDVLLNAGDNLVTAIDNAVPGQVIVLTPGEIYSVGIATYRIGKNIKIKGGNPYSLSVVCMTEGGPTTTTSMLNFVDGSTMNFVRFENIDFTGYCGNNTAGTKIGYLFNNNVLTTVGNLTFTNCRVHNFGNTPMRLQGAKNQVIDTLIFNKCTIFDIGFSSTYAVVNSNSADLFNNINFINCTVYNFKGSLILRTGQTVKSVNVTNCTIDQGMKDDGSSRYLIDLNTAVFTGAGVTIKNCVIGKTGGAKGANGIRYVDGTPVSVGGCFYTSDYVDDPIPMGTISTSLKSRMTAYTGTSASLWTDPLNGTFTLKDNSFAGKGWSGDLRWY